MISNEVQYRATKAHLERFEQASTNLAARPGKKGKLEQLELDAVNAQADDLRADTSGQRQNKRSARRQRANYHSAAPRRERAYRQWQSAADRRVD